MVVTVAVTTAVLLAASAVAGPPAGWKCHCANQSLCAPLRTPKADKEVFAYYEDAWTRPDYKQTWEDLFSGGTVTTIAACEGHVVQEPGVADARMSDEHLCYAHARGVRVVPACIGCDVWSGSPGGLSRCPGHTDKVAYNFNDTAARAAYVKNWSAVVHDYGYDGDRPLAAPQLLLASRDTCGDLWLSRWCTPWRGY
jgi:hypothetical protein